MATIRKRNNSYHVQVRKKGYPTLTKSFNNHATALAWAKKVESEIERHVYLDISIAQSTTVGEVVEKFKKEILPTKKRGQDDRAFLIAPSNLSISVPPLFPQDRG